MRFISPRTDFAFKKIFGSETSKNVCISFLNALLDFSDTPNEIISLEILDPWNAPKIKGLKDTYLDVKVKTSSGKEIIIEMQVLNIESFEKRVLYNAAKSYSNQIKRGEDYLHLNPVIALTIVDFEMFPETQEYVNNFLLKEKTQEFEYSGDIELVFVELPKFTKTINELKNIQDKWIYFLKEADSLEAIPGKFQNNIAFDEAFYIAETSHMSSEDRDILEKKQMYIADQKNSMLKAKRIGLEKGLEKGIEKGREEEREKNICTLQKKLNISYEEARKILS